ncbi:werner syndrome ATP-dependent helicase [Vigna unguiculata]|uniref:Werner syndrome ATP-dependent helicase n=1 Tax=Vigna unguiculata TaxID=3917 RepID=A0A4D6NDC0_VIGUN|nr:werner syndrome ATP-dependent helicase [Vigna unguiculata]
MVDENGVPIWMRNQSNPVVATTTVVDYNIRNNTYNLYDVTFESHNIHTLVTHHPSEVDRWLSNNAGRRQGLMVGLDIEWRPITQPNTQNPVATLQLCVGNACLVFQIIHAPYFSHSLGSFLQDLNVTFLGVGIRADAEKLLRDYGLHVANVCDLRSLAEVKLWRYPHLRQAGLKTLCLHVLGAEVEKPQSISRSLWDNRCLTAEQVKYAAIDAFLSYEIGRRLIESEIW